jgi:hypothetical protein
VRPKTVEGYLAGATGVGGMDVRPDEVGADEGLLGLELDLVDLFLMVLVDFMTGLIGLLERFLGPGQNQAIGITNTAAITKVAAQNLTIP